jgi:hypothetical protein
MVRKFDSGTMKFTMKCEEKNPSETCLTGLKGTPVKISKKIADLIPVIRFQFFKKSAVCFKLKKAS